MTTFTAGQPVTVHIGGIDNDPTGHEGIRFASADGATSRVDVQIAQRVVSYPVEWVVPVTPPCPWTEIGTLIRADHGEIYELDARDRWRLHSNGTVVDWATDIAPYNPRRLVPEQPARPKLETGFNATLRTWLPIEGTDRWQERHGRDSGTREQIERTYGPVTEVDGAAVAS